MNERKVVFPGDSEKYAKLQQTGHTRREFEEALDVRQMFEMIEQVLGDDFEFENVMDLGSGIGRASLAMSRLLLGGETYWLVDGKGENFQAGIHGVVGQNFYNDWYASQEFLNANGLFKHVLVNASLPIGVIERDILHGRKMDLVMSARAFGFHWPMALMMHFVNCVTKVGSVLVFESRSIAASQYERRQARREKAFDLLRDDLAAFAYSREWNLEMHVEVEIPPARRAFILARRVR